MNDIYMLTNFVDLSESIREPLKQTQRIKYTCFDASQNYIVFGASSGSLYLFNRKPCTFLHLIPNKHGPVNLLLISPKEKYIAFTTNKGIICVYVINLSSNSAPQVITANIGEAAVNCLNWCENEKQFYYGDRKGEVNLVSLTFFMGRTLLNISVHPILFLESPIVQISNFETLLLVSNYTKCILCNTEYEEFKQIGNRPRDGYYGTCFAISANENILASRIYCARPGSRFWEVDLEGNVIQTHQFKTALACPPTNITKRQDFINTHYDNNENNDCEVINYPPQNLQFSKLQTLRYDLILTFTETGLFIFDPRSSSVVLWCNEFDRINDCKVIENEIVIFTIGSLCSIRLETMQTYAIELVHSQQLLDCVHLLKTNLKYFAEKAKEQYDLFVLNEIKTYLMKTSQYEELNDLSVIFDSITQRESELPKSKRYENGIYVLENSFCDNLKCKTNVNDRQFKDALLTVTGKFGKNIIKYKFNIFAEDQKNLVNDLIPKERQIPFKEINEQFEDEEIVCNRILNNKTKAQNKQIDLPKERISDEEKTIQNLYIIFKSSKISNINFLDRYSTVFDRYDSREIIDLLGKLENVMIENGDTEVEAKRNCFEMYFNYLKPEIIWEIDDISREFIIDGFILINTNEMVYCDTCEFPVRFSHVSYFHDLGEVLIKFLWSRNEQQRCYDILKKCPSIMDVICRFYIQENQIDKTIAIVLNYGDCKLFTDASKAFDLITWKKCFEMFAAIQNGNFNCINCDRLIEIATENSLFYSWNCFLDIALQSLDPNELLNLLIKYSKQIPNNAIDREFFVKCLLK